MSTHNPGKTYQYFTKKIL